MKVEKVAPVQKISELNFTPPVKQKTQTSKVSKSLDINISNINISKEALKSYVRFILESNKPIAQIEFNDIFNMMTYQKDFFNRNPYSKYLKSLVQYI